MAETDYLTVHLSIKQVTRIFNNIIVDPTTGCWVWQGAKDGAGYGFTTCDMGRFRVHRILYAWAVGPIPRGQKSRVKAQIDHLCRNPSCCNPVHLELVTQWENVRRGVSPIAQSARRTHCAHGHLLTVTKNGKRRECKPCDNARKKKRVNGPDREYWLQKARETAMRWYDKHKRAT